jgi:hypothetical protein
MRREADPGRGPFVSRGGIGLKSIRNKIHTKSEETK